MWPWLPVVTQIEISEAGEQRDHHEDDGPKSGPDNDALCGEKLSNSYGSSELAEIEQLLKQKTFSRQVFPYIPLSHSTPAFPLLFLSLPFLFLVIH